MAQRKHSYRKPRSNTSVVRQRGDVYRSELVVHEGARPSSHCACAEAIDAAACSACPKANIGRTKRYRHQRAGRNFKRNCQHHGRKSKPQMYRRKCNQPIATKTKHESGMAMLAVTAIDYVTRESRRSQRRRKTITAAKFSPSTRTAHRNNTETGSE